MPQHTRPARPICPNCDGFASAAIATGLRLTDGSRDTVPVNCPACHGTGTGTAPARRALTATRR
ncbi:hypothetical protein [Kitasatospora cineracea]|uniref:hypothetical protein n=1 Tax=Kitasatospora cineracea TaxID=88074 RepID=UPI003401EBD7